MKSRYEPRVIQHSEVDTSPEGRRQYWLQPAPPTPSPGRVASARPRSVRYCTATPCSWWRGRRSYRPSVSAILACRSDDPLWALGYLFGRGANRIASEIGGW